MGMQDHNKSFQLVFVKQSFQQIHSAQFLPYLFSRSFEPEIFSRVQFHLYTGWFAVCRCVYTCYSTYYQLRNDAIPVTCAK